MSYDKFTCSYFANLPSRKRLQFDLDYLKDNAPDYLYHYSDSLYRVVIVRNYNAEGDACSYSVMVLGCPPAIGSWRSIYNSPILEKAVLAFNHAVVSHVNDDYLAKGDWFVSEL